MHMIPQSDVLQIALTLWKFVGEYLHYTPRKVKIYRAFNMLLLWFVLIFILANMKIVTGALYIKTILSAITVIHTIIKYLAFIYYKENIFELIGERLKFWRPQDFGDAMYKNAEKLFYFTKSIQTIIIASIIVTVELYSLKPLVDPANRFLFDTWAVYDNIIFETIILISQYYFLWLVAPIVVGYDAIYFSFCSHLLIQLRLLKLKMKAMKVSDHKVYLYECIRHHQLICSIFERMRQIYAWMLLFHYLVTLISACSQLYAIMLGGLNSMEILATFIYIFDIFAEFAYYTFPIEEVVFEFNDIANAIYMSPWFEREETFKRTLLIVMVKSQHQRYLSGGGMIVINVNTFGSVARKTFSFFAVLKNII